MRHRTGETERLWQPATGVSIESRSAKQPTNTTAYHHKQEGATDNTHATPENTNSLFIGRAKTQHKRRAHRSRHNRYLCTDIGVQTIYSALHNGGSIPHVHICQCCRQPRCCTELHICIRASNQLCTSITKVVLLVCCIGNHPLLAPGGVPPLCKHHPFASTTTR